YMQTKLAFAVGADFSYEIFRRTLYQPYVVHVSRNSSEVISGALAKVGVIVNGFFSPLLVLFSSSIILIAILSALLMVAPWMSLSAMVGFGLIYGTIMRATRRKLAAHSKQLATGSTQVVKILQEGIGGIRDVLINGSQGVYCDLYRRADIPLRNAQAARMFIGGAPRFAAEALGITFIAVLAYSLAAQPNGLGDAIAVLGVLALAAQRLLPVLQQGYMSIIQLRSSHHSLCDALVLLNQPIDEAAHGSRPKPLAFNAAIHLRDLSFRYTQQAPLVLQNVNLSIPRGSRTGFIGTTGSGKSTLLDIIMGLLTPTDGAVLIDDVELMSANVPAWQSRLAHVPQSIYLADASIAENIAFGVPAEQIDLDRVKVAARQAQIADHIQALPQQYSTRVGERGVRLSGGQRQRIGIARALYRQAEIIIFDEATSALDVETERAVMEAINSLGSDLTILIIAHRLSTLKGCDQVVEVQDGRIRVLAFGEIEQ
ncbi:MAG TPA: ABC transporter ATP-binding protein, partial [Nitrococcus sp.]|nr:ABC transporter ATP-binding protein [Nitrococcus sp.]